MVCNPSILEDTLILESQVYRLAQVCSGCELDGVCLCAALPYSTSRKLLAEFGRPLTLSAGQHLYRNGDPFLHFYAIRSGFTKSYTSGNNGDERIVAFNRAGDALGLEALADERHEISTVALTALNVCRISARSLLEAPDVSPELSRQLLRLVSRDLRRCQKRLITENLRADQRVAGFLLDLCNGGVSADRQAPSMTLPMSRADIGSYLNLAHETVTRTLTRLGDLDYIELRRRKISLLDVKGLQDLVTRQANRAN